MKVEVYLCKSCQQSVHKEEDDCSSALICPKCNRKMALVGTGEDKNCKPVDPKDGYDSARVKFNSDSADWVLELDGKEEDTYFRKEDAVKRAADMVDEENIVVELVNGEVQEKGTWRRYLR